MSDLLKKIHSGPKVQMMETFGDIEGSALKVSYSVFFFL